MAVKSSPVGLEEMVFDVWMRLLVIGVLCFCRGATVADTTFRAAMVQMSSRGNWNNTATENIDLGLSALDELSRTARRARSLILFFLLSGSLRLP